MTTKLAATLYRIGLSDRNAMHVISAVLEIAGLNLNDYVLSRESIRVSRQTARKSHAAELKSNFETTGIIVGHWDGKILEDIVGMEYVDRLPVMVSTKEIIQLLGVPKFVSGTRENQANAAFQQLQEWGLAERVCAMGFDTTATNTGMNKGACIRLERMLGRELLWLACRHHVLELLVSAAWDTLLAASSSPNVTTFTKFQNAWTNLDHTFKSQMVDKRLIAQLGSEKQELISMIEQHLNQNHHYGMIMANY
ncbi:uncharacterized protein LOC131689300 [Topomyia yanbarensis]|uniref:uncharacterized protein LOC131689300 n=1 Tax=Topomyia yanbarensis TaxID=2498891 RepID=UPI00273C3BE6|nr:uncharacterized protein LOC131689300 [Topomyia yanbarensis]